MKEDFKQFLTTVKNGIDSGEIKTSKKLSDLDIAVQYAIGELGKEHGYPLEITQDLLAEKIQQFAPELL